MKLGILECRKALSTNFQQSQHKNFNIHHTPYFNKFQGESALIPLPNPFPNKSASIPTFLCGPDSIWENLKAFMLHLLKIQE